MAVHETAPYFASWNIDSSNDREFFLTNFSSPALVAAAAGLSSSHVRFGGTGNNFLHYAVGGAPPCTQTGPTFTCLNETTWQGVIGLANAARSPLIFGVNFFPSGDKQNHTFDPTNAVEFFRYARARGDAIWGVECGNEINRQVTAQEQAAGLLALDDALAGVYGSDARPLLVGPDALGLHAPNATPGVIPPAVLLQYMSDFVVAMRGRLRAVTHHEYIEINETNVRDPAFLDYTYGIAEQVVRAIRGVSAGVEIWAGEIGPHNGQGGPGDATPGNCAGNRVCGRFGSALWYADAMASKARAGYAAFCRQDFIGADYGLTNFTTLAPTPDYWLLVLWQRLVGARVLAVTAAPADARVRVYAFCGTQAATATLVIINLADQAACLDAPGVDDTASTRKEFSLTASDGTVTAPGAVLNGLALNLLPSGALPPLDPTETPPTSPINLAPLSITIVTFNTSADACMN